MSIASQINRINNNIAAAYSVLKGKGGAIPSSANSANLIDTIDRLKTGITPSGSKSITENGTYDVTEYASSEVNVVANPKLTAKNITANRPVKTGNK